MVGNVEENESVVVVKETCVAPSGVDGSENGQIIVEEWEKKKIEDVLVVDTEHMDLKETLELVLKVFTGICLKGEAKLDESPPIHGSHCCCFPSSYYTYHGDDFRIIWYMLFNSALAYFINLTNFLVTKHTSALTLQKPHLVIFVMDSSIGQAAFDQSQAFKQSVAVGAVIITKMYGHTKGGGALSA
ncbi:unnamed protein product [Eruca vesicaria subsp. sativa]|uniref:SRP54-type proteins GTP-binding domain-containing protein n=1 Tax=Eruca vesicaria subsp. sativa TaxID=29727 RepID=A0ABC8IYW8_ERUVS|nr:unnamed protein product [Eruca vesicaria subsp. sativa]